jgi:hypothetical protein
VRNKGNFPVNRFAREKNAGGIFYLKKVCRITILHYKGKEAEFIDDRPYEKRKIVVLARAFLIVVYILVLFYLSWKR